MLAIKPAKHQGGPQHHSSGPFAQHQLLLTTLGGGVEIGGHGVHDRAADVHQARNPAALQFTQDNFGGGDVVAFELGWVGVADFGLQHHTGITALQQLGPAVTG